MITVGDASTHARFLQALTTSHGYTGRVEAWFNGVKIEDIPFQSGIVKVTGRNRERRSLPDLMVSEKLWPTLPTDSVAPYGVWLKAFGIVTSGDETFPEVPVFAGKLLTADGERWEGQIQCTAADPMWQINRESFEAVRRAPAGMGTVATIAMLLREVFPDATLEDQTGSTATVPESIAWDARDGSRGKAIDELAASIGAEVFARPTEVWPGGDFVIRPVPSLTDPIDWTLPTGSNAIVLADKRLLSGATVVNRWIVQVERTDAPPLYVPVTDESLTSPTRYGGPIGRLPKFYTNPLIGSEAQALVAGRARLNRSIGAARARTLTVPTNPALEGGTIMAVSVEAEPVETHIADDFGIPLTNDPASMSISTRSTGGEEE